MTDTWTQDDIRKMCDRISDHLGEWQGIPIPLGEDTPLVLEPGHPMRKIYGDLGQTEGVTIHLVVGPDEVPDDERVVNTWFSRARNCQVYVLDGGGRRYCATRPVSPDRSMDRLTFWLRTIGAADAWDLDAEHTARVTLKAMLSGRQWMHYDLTGTFLETSPRSNVSYLFRRLRPTVALSPRGKNGPADSMSCLAVLCMHPIGYYSQSWGGCMVPVRRRSGRAGLDARGRGRVLETREPACTVVAGGRALMIDSNFCIRVFCDIPDCPSWHELLFDIAAWPTVEAHGAELVREAAEHFAGWLITQGGDFCPGHHHVGVDGDGNRVRFAMGVPR